MRETASRFYSDCTMHLRACHGLNLQMRRLHQQHCGRMVWANDMGE